MSNSFGARATLRVGAKEYTMYRLDALKREGFAIERLPYSIRILLENLLRCEDGQTVTADDIRALASWSPVSIPEREIAFMPARVLLQDFTGVPCVVDLAAMRDAIAQLGGDPNKINPLQPVELVIDHSVQVDSYGSEAALLINADMEFQRNRERYAFLRWGQQGFRNFKVVPPDTGIVHQINLEYLGRVVFSTDEYGETALPVAYPDTLVGTDSHTTMINGLGVLGWGVGGIEAEAAMLGQPVSMLIPEVIGFRLTGQLPEGSTATDLVLVVTEMLRKKGVVGKFVEFYGPGLAALPLADRATIANMAPEYGATCGIFPVDVETLRYLRFTGRSSIRAELVEAYMKEQGLFATPDTPEAQYTDRLDLDLSTVEPSVAGPKRPQDRIRLSGVKTSFQTTLPTMLVSAKDKPAPALNATANVRMEDGDHTLQHGSIVIGAITSCTNTSNPSVMIAAGLVAKKAVERGLSTPTWVKTSLAPGSMVATDYLDAAGLTPFLNQLRFHTVGYGCTTCIGNSGPLPEQISQAVKQGDLVAVSVLSGNRNFEGRVHGEVRANYLMSPPLVVAYALAGRIDLDLTSEPIGTGSDGQPVYLRDIWPTQHEIQQTMAQAVRSEMFISRYATVFNGDERWQNMPVPQGSRFAWEASSTYVQYPPYFEGMSANTPASVPELQGVRALALLGDSVTTDHISPAGSIKSTTPAGQYLIAHGIEPTDFNSYGARRGNHEVMVRGTFANVRLRNKLAPGTEGGWTTYLPTSEVMTIYDASIKYQESKTPLLVIAGKEYGTGSSRDWAAKGPMLLGVRMVLAESFERIHRSNLIGMGILPLQFEPGENAETLGLNGQETFETVGLPALISGPFAVGRKLMLRYTRQDGSTGEIPTIVRIDTPREVEYYLNGGILLYVLRKLCAN